MKKIDIAGLEEAYRQHVSGTIQAMGFDAYKVELYRNRPTVGLRKFRQFLDATP